MAHYQSDMQMHDELAALFSRNLNFNPEVQVTAPAPVPVPQEQAHPEPSQPIIYSISQHYNHSAHCVKPQVTQEPEVPQRRSSEPPQTENSTAESVLRNHGVDPATLTPSQVQLFRIADPPQQMRLIELWNICPPGRGADIPALAWSSTTVEQEEHLARMRYERANQMEQVMSLDGTQIQNSDGKWIGVDSDTEPYMASGYEDLMRAVENHKDSYTHFGSAVAGAAYTPATDPVYMGPDYAREQQELNMASQYGAFQEFRGQAGAEAMDVM